MSLFFEDTSVGRPGGGGTVTSVSGGVGLTGTPDPVVGAGTLDLDIFSLTTETTLATGDFLPFVDVSVGTTPADQRKVTLGNLAAGLNALLDHGLLAGLVDDDHPGHPWLLGRAGGQTQHGGTGAADDYIVRATSNATPGRIILGDDITLADSVVVHGTETGITIGGALVATRLAIHDQEAIDANLVIHKHHDAGTVAPVFLGARTRGTETAETVVADNDVLLRLLAVGYDGADFERSSQILFESDDPTPSGTSMGGRIVASTTPRSATALVDRVAVNADGLFEWLNTPSPASLGTVTAMRWAPTMTLPSTIGTIRGLVLAPVVTCSDNLASMRYFYINGLHTQDTINPSNLMIMSAIQSEITSRSLTNGIGPWVPDLFVDLNTVQLTGNGTPGAITAATPASYIYVGCLESPAIRATEGASYTFTGTSSGVALYHGAGTLSATGAAATNSVLVIPYRTVLHDVGPTVTQSGGGVVTLDISTTVYTRNYTRAATGVISCIYSELATAANKWFLYGAGTADSSLVGRMFIGGPAGTAPNTDVDVDGDLATRAANLALVNGNNDNIAIGARSFIRITGPTGAFTIRGIASGFDGKRLVLYNTTTQNMTINHEDAGSTAANRIRTMTGAAVVSAGEAAGELIYDATLTRWLLINTLP